MPANTIPANSGRPRCRHPRPRLSRSPGEARRGGRDHDAGRRQRQARRQHDLATTNPVRCRTRSCSGSPRSPARATCRRCRHAMSAGHRLRSEGGFTMVLALMVLTVSSLLIAAAFVAAQGDVRNTQHDLDGKRAYSAARAGLADFLSSSTRTPSSGRRARRAPRPRSRAGRPTSLLLYDRARQRRRALHDRQPGGDADRLRHRHVPDEVHRDLRTRPRSRGRSSPASGATPRSTSSGTRSTRRWTRTPTPTRRTSRTAPSSCATAGRRTAG